MAPQIWEHETPETDYERWLREVKLGYHSAEKPQSRLSAPNVVDRPLSFTTSQKTVGSSGLLGEETVRVQPHGEKEGSSGSSYGTFITSPSMHSSPSHTRRPDIPSPPFGRVMLFCFFAISLLAFVAFRRRAKSKTHSKILDKQTETGCWNMAVNDYEV